MSVQPIEMTLARIAVAVEKLADAMAVIKTNATAPVATKKAPTAAEKKKAATAEKKAETVETTDDLDMGDAEPAIDVEAAREKIRKALKDYAALEGRDAAIKIINDAGEASAVGEIDPSKFDAVNEALKG